jgi:hypothetical protein
MSSESPFNVYLHTNYAPTFEEKAAIKTLCADPLQDIQRLDKEIDKLEEEIARLHRRREELQTFVDDHRMLLSPIRQLSPEVLQRIFVECVAADCHRDFYAASWLPKPQCSWEGCAAPGDSLRTARRSFGMLSI